MTLTESLNLRVTPDEMAGIRDHASRLGMSISEVVRGQVRATTRQRAVYPFDGSGASFVKDLWADRCPHDFSTGEVTEARDRLACFRAWEREVKPTFAAFSTTTANAAEVVEPQYRPLISTFVEDRPLYAACERGQIRGSTPFTLPGRVTDANVDAAVATHVEGTNPADGTLTFGDVAGNAITVTPAGISGTFRITREIADSSNPAIDLLALAVMRQSFARQTEARVYAALNAAQAGTITGGFVPSGAMVRTSTAAALPSDLRKTVAGYMNGRGRRPRAAIASSRTTVAEALETLDDSSAEGSEEFWRVGNTPVFLSPQITGTAAGDGDVFVLGSTDVFAWSSPLMEFRYWERSGPAHVDVSLYGYFAAAVVNAAGVAAIRHT